VGKSPEEVAKAFNVKNWPNGEGTIDLGNRKLSIIPIPGHEESSIAVYDHKSGDMLTGDTVYPGNIFLSGGSSWKDFKASVNRLHKFTETHPVRNFLGAHIEMAAEPGKDFSYGSTYHPNEHNLPLRQEHLNEIKQYLDGNPDAKTKYFADIILRVGG
jgi:glyoxylase-like metal-dependent hydrolase (beta-lactamase superfamily II)